MDTFVVLISICLLQQRRRVRSDLRPKCSRWARLCESSSSNTVLPHLLRWASKKAEMEKEKSGIGFWYPVNTHGHLRSETDKQTDRQTSERNRKNRITIRVNFNVNIFPIRLKYHVKYLTLTEEERTIQQLICTFLYKTQCATGVPTTCGQQIR